MKKKTHFVCVYVCTCTHSTWDRGDDLSFHLMMRHNGGNNAHGGNNV